MRPNTGTGDRMASARQCSGVNPKQPTVVGDEDGHGSAKPKPYARGRWEGVGRSPGRESNPTAGKGSAATEAGTVGPAAATAGVQPAARVRRNQATPPGEESPPEPVKLKSAATAGATSAARAREPRRRHGRPVKPGDAGTTPCPAP